MAFGRLESLSFVTEGGVTVVLSAVMGVLGLSSLSEKGDPTVNIPTKTMALTLPLRWICTEPESLFSLFFQGSASNLNLNNNNTKKGKTAFRSAGDLKRLGFNFFLSAK